MKHTTLCLLGLALLGLPVQPASSQEAPPADRSTAASTRPETADRTALGSKAPALDAAQRGSQCLDGWGRGGPA